jgi:hypothetical protein
LLQRAQLLGCWIYALPLVTGMAIRGIGNADAVIG